MNAIELIRVSTDAQDVARQRTDMAKLDRRFGLTTLRTIELHGVSGTATLRNDQVQKILTDMANPKIDGIKISAIDRLFRPGKGFGIWAILDTFLENRKAIWSQREGLVELWTNEGRAKAEQAGMTAGNQWRIIRETSMDGKIEKIKNGERLDPVPYGLLRIPRHAAENPNTVILDPSDCNVPGVKKTAVVHLVFELRAAGLAHHSISRELERRGIKSPGHWGRREKIFDADGRIVSLGPKNWVEGGGFNRQILIQWIANRAYKGELVNKNAPDVINMVPAIVDADLWERAQSPKKGVWTGRPTEKYLLRNFLECGRCGHQMFVNGRASNTCYFCGRIERKPYRRLCDAGTISTRKLEPAAWAEIWSVFKNPEWLHATGNAYYDSIRRPDEANVEAMRAEIAQLKRGIEDVQFMVRRGKMDRSHGVAAIDEDQARIAEIESQLAAMDRIVEMPTLAATVAACREIASGPEPLPEDRRDILKGLIDLKMVWDDRTRELTITGKVPVPVAAAGAGTNGKCNSSVHCDYTFSVPIPFIRKVRVA